MIKASEKASKVLIRDFGEIEKLQVSKKGPSDFVTNSDLRVEKIIIEELKKAKPNYSIISEDDILHHILRSITECGTLTSWKQKTKRLVMVKIKENNI